MFKYLNITYNFFFIVFAIFPNIYPQILEPEEIYNNVHRSVVTVWAHDEEDIKIGRGSGVIIDTGIVVTNFHVYEESERISISHFGKKYKITKIIGVDIDKDVIICKTSNQLLPLEIASVNDFKIGERIYAIGNPLGFENSITEGLISGIREIDNNVLLQISAFISYGSSGGAVVNSRGKLIGISSAGFLYTDINFAIPIDAIYNLSTNCSLEDTVCSIKVAYFLKCYQAYMNLDYEETLTQLNNYISVDSGENIHKELERILKIISLELLFETDYSTADLLNMETLFRRDSNFVKALNAIDLLEDGNVYEALNRFLIISKSDPQNPNYYYCLGRCYESLGDKKTQLEHFYKKAFFLGWKFLGSLLYKKGIITQLQWDQFR